MVLILVDLGKNRMDWVNFAQNPVDVGGLLLKSG